MSSGQSKSSDHDAGSASHDDDHKTEKKLGGSKAGGTDMPAGEGGEDEGSAPVEGKDDHLKEDQKPITK